jgi:hypothetical protein
VQSIANATKLKSSYWRSWVWPRLFDVYATRRKFAMQSVLVHVANVNRSKIRMESRSGNASQRNWTGLAPMKANIKENVMVTLLVSHSPDTWVSIDL